MSTENRSIEEHATANFIKALVTAVLLILGGNLLFHYHQRGNTIQKLQERIEHDSLARFSDTTQIL